MNRYLGAGLAVVASTAALGGNPSHGLAANRCSAIYDQTTEHINPSLKAVVDHLAQQGVRAHVRILDNPERYNFTSRGQLEDYLYEVDVECGGLASHSIEVGYDTESGFASAGEYWGDEKGQTGDSLVDEGSIDTLYADLEDPSKPPQADIAAFLYRTQVDSNEAEPSPQSPEASFGDKVKEWVDNHQEFAGALGGILLTALVIGASLAGASSGRSPRKNNAYQSEIDNKAAEMGLIPSSTDAFGNPKQPADNTSLKS